MSRLELLPAVDVAGGRAVRPGANGSAPDVGDPVEQAARWQRAGARWVHLVDLDAAFARGHNRDLLAAVVAGLDCDVQVSGGVHDDASLASALATGCRRVVVGTAALTYLAWCERVIGAHGDRLAVGLDVHDERLAARGGSGDGGELWPVLDRLERAGCRRYIVTDVTRDGSLDGPNVELLRAVCSRTDAPVLASGGVSTLDDVRALAAMTDDGVEGAVIGTALYTGAFSLEQALAML
ncbi:MAG: HisA/HisF-related TIM barrel protein [Actinomycetota bacterium]|nr:HisA/HisF-related TIM barrel protein [Actinomycetota bacterium]